LKEPLGLLIISRQRNSTEHFKPRKDEMNVEFNQRTQLERDTHLKDLESTKVKLCEGIEDIKREHAKEISHLEVEIDETKQFIENKLQIKGLEQANEKLK
jgi:hypothetical protein